MIRLAILFLALGVLACLCAQDAPPGQAPLNRHYREGETLTYRMKGTNEKWRYEILAAWMREPVADTPKASSEAIFVNIRTSRS